MPIPKKSPLLFFSKEGFKLLRKKISPFEKGGTKGDLS